jgi:hypothetical protein
MTAKRPGGNDPKTKKTKKTNKKQNTNKIFLRSRSMAAAALAPAIIYFDNDARMISRVSSVCPTIRAVQIDESTPHNPKHPRTSPILDQLLAHVPASNPYRQFVSAVSDSEGYDPVSGLNDAHFAMVNAWIAETEGSPRRYAIFDWDRTISKIEGFILPPSPHSIGQTVEWARPLVSGVRRAAITFLAEIAPEHVLEYLCEGQERVTKLKTMMAKLVSAGIEVVILTNNPGCKEASFLELVRALMPSGYDGDPRICSQNSGGDKGAALAADARFAGICALPAKANNNLYSGGARRHRKLTRRRDQRKAKSRRR